jgi:hypothetical protein
MSTVQRKSRRRADALNPIIDAWNAGEAPPDEAFEVDQHDLVVDCMFFAWAEGKQTWLAGTHHPHRELWLDALKEHSSVTRAV